MVFKAIEMDIQLSFDDEIIILHDDKVDRTTNQKGFLKDYTLEEVNNKIFTMEDNSENIPTLKWMFEQFGDSIIYVIEIKKIIPAQKRKILFERLKELIQRYNVESKCIIISFYPENLLLSKKTMPNIETGLLVDTNIYLSRILLNYAFLFKVETISFNYDGLNKKMLKFLRKLGYKIGVWTVNKKEDVEKFKKLKLDYITTDFYYLNNNSS